MVLQLLEQRCRLRLKDLASAEERASANIKVLGCLATGQFLNFFIFDLSAGKIRVNFVWKCSIKAVAPKYA